MSKWAVLVVHGVGDTRPGVTGDIFMWSLVAHGAILQPDGFRLVRWLPEQTGTSAPEKGNDQSGEESLRGVKLFPLHERLADITDATGDQPKQAVFAEVYWADLSRIRE